MKYVYRNCTGVDVRHLGVINIWLMYLHADKSRLYVRGKEVSELARLIVMSLAHCDVTKKAFWRLDWDYKNPIHLDVVDRYLRRMGDKRFQTRLRRVWNRCIPMSSRYRSTKIKELWIRCLVHQETQIKVYFKVKIQKHRRFVGFLIVIIQIRNWRLIACVITMTSRRLFVMRNKASHPLRLKPYRYILKYQMQLYICRSMTYLCQGFFIVCVYMDKNPD